MKWHLQRREDRLQFQIGPSRPLHVQRTGEGSCFDSRFMSHRVAVWNIYTRSRCIVVCVTIESCGGIRLERLIQHFCNHLLMRDIRAEMVTRRSLMGNVGAKKVFSAVPDDSLVDDDPQIRTARHDTIRSSTSPSPAAAFSKTGSNSEEERVYGVRSSYSVARFRFRFGHR
jgi:hypothetical protein